MDDGIGKVPARLGPRAGSTSDSKAFEGGKPEGEDVDAHLTRTDANSARIEMAFIFERRPCPSSKT